MDWSCSIEFDGGSPRKRTHLLELHNLLCVSVMHNHSFQGTELRIDKEA